MGQGSVSLGGGCDGGGEGREEGEDVDDDGGSHQPREVCRAATGGGLAEAARAGSDATATRSREAAAAASPGRRRHAGAPRAESHGSILSAAFSPPPSPKLPGVAAAVAVVVAAPHWSARRPPTAGWTWTALSVARKETTDGEEGEQGRESAGVQSSAAADDDDDNGERTLFSFPLAPLPSAALASASPVGVSGDLAQATAEGEQKTSQQAAVKEAAAEGRGRRAPVELVLVAVAAASAAVEAVSDLSVLLPNQSSEPPPPPNPKPNGSAPKAIAGCASLPTSEGGPRLEGVESSTTPRGVPPARAAASAAADAAGGSETAMRAAPLPLDEELLLLPWRPLLLPDPPAAFATGLAATARRGVGKPGACSSAGDSSAEEEESAAEASDGVGGGGTSEIVQIAASAALDPESASVEGGATADAPTDEGMGTASAERDQSAPSARSVAVSVGCAASAASGLLPSHLTRAPLRSPEPTPPPLEGAAGAAAEAAAPTLLDGEEEEEDLEKLTAAARRFADPGGQ